MPHANPWSESPHGSLGTKRASLRSAHSLETLKTTVECEICNRSFKNAVGLRRHMRFCQATELAVTKTEAEESFQSEEGGEEITQPEGSEGVGELEAASQDELEDSDDIGLTDDDIDEEDYEDEDGEDGLIPPDGDINLRDQMKGVMLSKVNELIDETSATGPGKCHCCGEDLDTAHLVSTTWCRGDGCSGLIVVVVVVVGGCGCGR
uniref:C2H2-type domain-containing protein n=1 Tax=Timema monikensis TaxID=170555 RepID=A0A7R9E5F4_9NEOP|nr:unnamed protein product [Timema monikensis]